MPCETNKKRIIQHSRKLVKPEPKQFLCDQVLGLKSKALGQPNLICGNLSKVQTVIRAGMEFSFLYFLNYFERSGNFQTNIEVRLQEYTEVEIVKLYSLAKIRERIVYTAYHAKEQTKKG